MLNTRILLVGALLCLSGCPSNTGGAPPKAAPTEAAAAPTVTPYPVDSTGRADRRPIESVLPFIDPLPTPPDLSADDLFAEGDRLADAGKMPEALSHWRWAYVYAMPSIRELAFRVPVGAAFMARPALQQRMLHEVDKEWPNDALQKDEAAYRALGLVSAKLDLRKVLVDLFTEEVAGFYDPDSKDLVLIAEGPKKKGLLGSLFDFGGDADEQKMVLAHELSHALADQHFDLFSLQKSVRHDDDMATALSGLIEGEAMVTMILSVLPPEDRGNFLYSPSRLTGLLMEMVLPAAMSFAGGKAFKNAPEILQQSLVIPYTKGMSFALHVVSQAQQWEDLNRAFADPPTSTEQLLHPERYSGKRDVPTAITLPETSPKSLDKYPMLKENCLGEFGIQMRLRKTLKDAHTDPTSDQIGAAIVRAASAAEGWDGDTYRVYRGEDDALILLWATTWDSEAEAREFEEAVTVGATEKTRVWRRASDVFLIGGAPKGSAEELSAWLEAATKAPKHFVLKTAQSNVAFPTTPDPMIAKRSVGVDELPIVEPSMVRKALEMTGRSRKGLIDRYRAAVDEICQCKTLDCSLPRLKKTLDWLKASKSDISRLDADLLGRLNQRLKKCVNTLNKELQRRAKPSKTENR
ncbi:MAG: hypothetical protein ACI9OJ_005168 [Myxococcota bacterium]|jgi:hypothetical protein